MTARRHMGDAAAAAKFEALVAAGLRAIDMDLATFNLWLEAAYPVGPESRFRLADPWPADPKDLDDPDAPGPGSPEEVHAHASAQEAAYIDDRWEWRSFPSEKVARETCCGWCGANFMHTRVRDEELGPSPTPVCPHHWPLLRRKRGLRWNGPPPAPKKPRVTCTTCAGRRRVGNLVCEGCKGRGTVPAPEEFAPAW